MNAVFFLEEILERDQDIRFVIDDQDHALLVSFRDRRGHEWVCLGIVMVKLVPPMGLGSTVMVPL